MRLATFLLVCLTTRVFSMNVLIVEADGYFDGHQRVRVPKDASIEAITSAIHALLPPSAAGDATPMTIFDASANTFVPLTSAAQVKTHARILFPRRPSGAVAAIASRGFNFAFDKGEMTIHGEPVLIDEVGNTGQGTGLTIWDGSVVLAKYLEQQPRGSPHSVAGRRVIELGAGTGLVGLAAAFCGADDVLLTDLAYTLANTNHNIALNKERLRALHPTQTTRAAELDWFHRDFPSSLQLDAADVILGSDIVWVETLIPALVATIERLLRWPLTPGRSKKNRLMLLSHQTRSSASDDMLFRLLGHAGLSVRRLLDSPDDVSRVAAVYPDGSMAEKIRLFEIQDVQHEDSAITV
ncbi:hypothetical protein SDRG_01792 [Saprolegnia diclina VS20]|uniref:FAM86 N-terminal domain-containing protein n=1 Tax=Saprolegnia diclina (strain VS20) TaxID=1156394 RepID=T0R302_SAPDV|nr:hypothetical protein SDRG_01792 [Saprolegnia diclina VS20]EQC40720.1 hypothetical protein SDRG_01792 [Saprolegnia diclina VS20]|eukprot:XP_008605564.1 hypothetical protein SDRG_01792 [Saprolegnia diclina VS20]